MLFVYCRRTASSLGEWRCMRMLRDLLEPFGTSSYTTKEKRQIPFKFCKLARHWQIFWHILPNISLRSSANLNNSPKTLVFLKFFFPVRRYQWDNISSFQWNIFVATALNECWGPKSEGAGVWSSCTFHTKIFCRFWLWFPCSNCWWTHVIHFFRGTSRAVSKMRWEVHCQSLAFQSSYCRCLGFEHITLCRFFYWVTV